MLILVATLLTLISAVVILYPLGQGSSDDDLPEDETSPQIELTRRLDDAMDGLRNTELENAIGNLADEDYRWLRKQYMTEAAVVMKAMELEEEQEEELLAAIEQEVRKARSRGLGQESKS